MAFGINSNPGSAAINSIAQYQQSLLQTYNQASSGKRITSAAIDPSGVAIYNALTAQSAGFDAANGNIVDASNASNVADGSLSTTSSALSRLNTLAIQASSDFISSSDRAALQAEANQLVQQVNTNASNTNFNGNALLSGQFSGATPASPASATVPSNASLAGGGQLVTSATASATSVNGTIGISVSNTGSGAQANLTFTDSATGSVTNFAPAAAGSTVTVNGTAVQLGNFTTNDAGTSATIQVAGPQSFTNNATLNVQSGANQGVTTQLNLPNGTSAGLGLQNIDFSTSANATNAQGQISAAIQSLNAGRATLGAQGAALNAQSRDNNTASVNLTASASAIGDANFSQIASELNSLQVRQQISVATLANSNNEFGYLNRFFSVSA